MHGESGKNRKETKKINFMKENLTLFSIDTKKIPSFRMLNYMFQTRSEGEVGGNFFEVLQHQYL